MTPPRSRISLADSSARRPDLDRPKERAATPPFGVRTPCRLGLPDPGEAGTGGGILGRVLVDKLDREQSSPPRASPAATPGPRTPAAPPAGASREPAASWRPAAAALGPGDHQANPCRPEWQAQGEGARPSPPSGSGERCAPVPGARQQVDIVGTLLDAAQTRWQRPYVTVPDALEQPGHHALVDMAIGPVVEWRDRG